jgi:hypothetical protein
VFFKSRPENQTVRYSRSGVDLLVDRGQADGTERFGPAMTLLSEDDPGYANVYTLGYGHDYDTSRSHGYS